MPFPAFLLYLLAAGSLGLSFVSALPLVDEASTPVSSTVTDIVVVPVAAETDTNIVGPTDFATRSNSSLSHGAVAKNTVAADPISKYTVDFFLDNIAHAYKKKQHNKCIFYANELLSHEAAVYAEKNNKVSLWDVWADPKCKFYKTVNVRGNPLRAIMNNEAERRTYFSHMSEAYAKHCTGNVKVMTRRTTVGAIPKDGIWAKVERPTLQTRGSGCDKIDAINPTGGYIGLVWKLHSLKVRDMVKSVLEPRAPDAARCISDDELAWLDTVVKW